MNKFSFEIDTIWSWMRWHFSRSGLDSGRKHSIESSYYTNLLRCCCGEKKISPKNRPKRVDICVRRPKWCVETKNCHQKLWTIITTPECGRSIAIKYMNVKYETEKKNNARINENKPNPSQHVTEFQAIFMFHKTAILLLDLICHLIRVSVTKETH